MQSARVPGATGTTGTAAWRIGGVLAVAALVKLVLLVPFEYRVYDDVIRAVNFGHAHLADPRVYEITSKTWVGPVLWALLYHQVGIGGLKILNLVLFVVLYDLQRRMGRLTETDDAVVLALALFAFYPGTNLTVVAGEQDDGMTLLFFALGVLWHLRGRGPFVAGFLMGVAFLFKFTALIFFAGFALHLLLKDGPRVAVAAALGMVVPFLVLNLTDGFDSTRNFIWAAGKQLGYSTWGNVAFKLVSTGMLPAFVLAGWAWADDRRPTTQLFCLVPTAYLAYVFASRDAFASGFVMMQGIFFLGFPLALFLLRNAWVDRILPRPLAIRVTLAAYVAVTSAITWHNVAQDTIDVRHAGARAVLYDRR